MSDTQRTDHTSLPPELWLEIFRYATYVPRARCISPRDSFEIQRPFNPLHTPVSSIRTKCNLVLVCRAWRRVATELLYEHVVINSSRRAYLLGRTLESNNRRSASASTSANIGPDGVTVERGHARWIRHLEIHTCSRTSKTAPFWYAIAGILSMLPNLHAVSGFWERPLSKGMLDVFTHYLGESVRALYWEEGEVPEGEASLLSPTFLPKYRSLRVLDIRKLAFENARSVPELDGAPPVLPGVIDLLIPTCPAIMGFATKLALPALRRLVLDASAARTRAFFGIPPALDALLAVHGPKLTTLELLPVESPSYTPGPVDITAFLQPDVCPQLDTLVFDCRERILGTPILSALQPAAHTPAKSLFSPLPAQPVPPLSECAPPLVAAHAVLRRVGIRGMGISRLYPNRPTHAQLHLRAFAEQRELFPALEVVRTLGFLVDACSDPFARDIFIWWTEKYESAALDLQDGEGVVWMYTDPESGEEKAAMEEQLMGTDCVDYVHKSDAEQYNLAKAQT